jgi:16S rRNA (guanine1207-N2)-methyltransferase
MRATRLNLALDSGLVAVPDGVIAVYGPDGAEDLHPFPRDQVVAVTSDYLLTQSLTAQGFKVARHAPDAALAVVCLPRSKAHAHALLAAAAKAPMVLVDGAKTDGIEPLYKDLSKRLPVTEALSKAHGRVFAFPGTDALTAWAAQDIHLPDGFITRPGVFSADGPDPASVLLAQALPERMPGYGVDLGAGWGYLARAVLARKSVKRLDLVETDATALDCAKVNIPDERARFIWGDATQYRADGYADFVVCNPPFHRGRQADPALGMAFITAAARMLSREGEAWFVANRTLPYGDTFRQHFAEVSELPGSNAFRLIRAAKPTRPRKAGE